MACGFDKGLLAAHYDGEADASERAEVERHAASCPECARDLADMKELTGRLRGLGPVKAPASLASEVAKEIGPRRASASSRRWMGWSLSAAAALFLAVGTVMVLDRSAPESPVAVAPDSLRQKDPAKAEEPRREEEFAAKAAPKPAPAAEKSKESAGPPVLVVSAIDPSKARAEVEAFLRERARAFAPPKDRTGKDDLDLTPYLEVELTEEESQILEARLRKLESVTVAKSTIDAELLFDRNQPGLAMKELDRRGRTAPTAPEAKKTEDSLGGAKAADSEQRSRLDKAPRRPVIFVFRQAPKK